MCRMLIVVVVMSGGTAVADVAKKPQPAGGAPAKAPKLDREPFEGDPGPLRRPPPKPVPVKPAAEIATTGKQLAGTWKCKGNTQMPEGSSTPLVATMTVKLELDNAWIVTTLVEKTGPLKWTEYRTYDAIAKQWTRHQMANTSGHVTSTSAGEQNGAWTWEGTATSSRGSVQLRDHEQLAGGQLKLWGESMLGGAWQKLYEVTCTK